MATIANLIPFLIGLIIGVPSAVLYCLELWIIFAHFSDFRSSFFMLVIVRTFASLINFLFTFLVNRIGNIGLFMSVYLMFPRSVLAFLFFMATYAIHMDNLITAFMLLNRLTSIIRPMDYEKLWRIGLPISLAITFLLPLPFTIPILPSDMYIHVQPDNVTFTLDVHFRPTEDINVQEIGAFSAIGFAVVCFVLNIATVVCYKMKKQQNANLTVDSRMERKMTIYTVVTFLSHLVMAIFSILIYITMLNHHDEKGNRYSLFQKWFSATLDQNEALFWAVFGQNPWVNDLCTVVIPAWLLVWASTKMREIAKKRIGHTTSSVAPFSS